MASKGCCFINFGQSGTLTQGFGGGLKTKTDPYFKYKYRWPINLIHKFHGLLSEYISFNNYLFLDFSSWTAWKPYKNQPKT